MGPAAREALREAHTPETARPASCPSVRPAGPGARAELAGQGRGVLRQRQGLGLSRERGKLAPGREAGSRDEPPSSPATPRAPVGACGPWRLLAAWAPPSPLLTAPFSSGPLLPMALPFPDCRPRLPSWQPFPGAPTASDLLLQTDCASLRRLRHAAQDGFPSLARGCPQPCPPPCTGPAVRVPVRARLPLQPVRGCALTLPAEPGAQRTAPPTSVCSGDA